MNPRALAPLAAVALAAATPRVDPPPTRHVLAYSGTETIESVPYDSDAALAASEVVASYFDIRPRDFAGKYVDTVTGDLVVLVTRNSDAHRSVLAARTRYPLVVREAAFSLADLVRVTDLVADRMEALDAQGIEVAGVGPDEDTNRVRVLLVRDTPDARRAVLATLSLADAAMVSFAQRGYSVLT